MNKYILPLISFAGVFVGLFASEVLMAQTTALEQTQNLLRDTNQVQKEALDTPAAKEADRNASITTLGDPELKQGLYDISADLLPWLTEAAAGDSEKMSELLAEASKNPAAFYDKIPSAQRAKIKALSETIDSRRNKNKAP